VLSLQEGRWMIRHYNLTVPIPNPLMGEVKNRIAAHLKAAAKWALEGPTPGGPGAEGHARGN